MGQHLHLDLVGGIAGDMFAAALLEVFPAQKELAFEMLRELLPDIKPQLDTSPVQGFSGARLILDGLKTTHHRKLSDITLMLNECSTLSDEATRIANGIFALLAKAEAKVHGVSPEEVHFHEVGAEDSIADIALAGYLIDVANKATWSVGEIPTGSGTVKTAHGILPVPAPATLELLRDFILVDDGIPGERVTPTGAAILTWLKPVERSTVPAAQLTTIGNGFGTKIFPDRPNVVRAQLLEIPAPQTPSPSQALTDNIVVLSFEIDDQTAEDLATGLENLRQEDGVLDVLQTSVTGKKGRLGTSVRVLCNATKSDLVVSAVFRETSTLGIRQQNITRHILARTTVERENVRVKIAQRPGGDTIKAEADDIAKVGSGYASRQKSRRKAETDD